MHSFLDRFFSSICMAIAVNLVCILPSIACEYLPDTIAPPFPRVPGDQLGFITYAPDAKAPIHLPANALGVLYNAAPTGIAQAKLGITEVHSGKRLPIRVTRLTALKRAKLPEVAPQNGADPALRKAEPDALYRVAPVQGFRPGQRYIFTSRPGFRAITHVVIDPVAVDMETERIRMQPAREPIRRWADPDGCWLSHDTVVAIKQEAAYAIPKALQPYRHLIFAFHAPLDGGWHFGQYDFPPNEEPPPTEIHYTPARYGLRDGAFGAYQSKIGAKPIVAVSQIGFLEVEDRLRAVSITLPTGSTAVPVHDSRDMLEAAIATGNPATLRAELMAVPRIWSENIRAAAKRYFWDARQAHNPRGWLLDWWDRPRFQWRRQRLLQLVGAQLAHPDAEVRRAVPQAVLGATHYDGLNRALARQAIAILFAALKDPDEGVRHLALDALMVLKARVMDKGLPINLKVYAPAIPALIATMLHGEETHRYNAASSLTTLHALSPQIVPAMLIAGERAGALHKLNRMARNIATVRQALQLATRSTDAHTRTNAALALDPPREPGIAAPADEPTGLGPEHISEVCKHDGPCMSSSR